jgi:PIN domain nuclease of toxin-antitoxin system
MTSLLLDTHIFLWWIDQDPRLTSRTRDAIADPGARVVVSAVSVWEIGIKRDLGKLRFTRKPTQTILDNGFAPLDITVDHAEAAPALPRLHADPFDRMLIAQAVLERLVLVTADDQIRRYAGQVAGLSLFEAAPPQG